MESMGINLKKNLKNISFGKPVLEVKHEDSGIIKIKNILLSLQSS